ncbi:MAG: hypothetical protein KF809_14880 [Chloroflexi bacterium]|nr:hypothetical protein [Chloroflexota bacterium]
MSSTRIPRSTLERRIAQAAIQAANARRAGWTEVAEAYERLAVALRALRRPFDP